MTVTTVIVTGQRPRRCDPEAHLVVAHHRGGTWIFSLEPSDNPSDIEGRRSDLCEVNNEAVVSAAYAPCGLQGVVENSKAA